MKKDDSWIPVVSGDSKTEIARNAKLFTAKKRKVFLRNSAVILLVAAVCAAMTYFTYRCVFLGNAHHSRSSDRGYYSYQNTTYYLQDGVWYEYDDALGWVLADPDESFLEDYKSYYNGTVFNYQNGASDFSGSDYYKPYEFEVGNQYNNNPIRNNENVLNFEDDLDDQ